MTVYATARDILDRYAHVGVFLSGLTDDGEPDTAPLERALEEAGSEIDGAEYADLFERRAKIARQLLADMADGKAELGLEPERGGSGGGVKFDAPPSRFRDDVERMGEL